MDFSKINDRREEGETTLRRCQLVQLRMLHVIDAICKELKLTYLLESGTLLGAIRHQGFIPWDDDIDIGMPRKDYEKFLAKAPELLPQGLSLQKPCDYPRIAIPYAKVRDDMTFYFERRLDMSTADPSGIFVDVFPYDDVPNVGHKFSLLLSRLCASSWKRTRYYYNFGGSNPLGVIGRACLGSLFHLVHWIVWLIVVFLKFFFPAKQVALCLNDGTACFYEKAKLFPAKMHVFEDGVFPVPNEAEGILEALYGNWRQIPPPDKRPRHACMIDPFHSAMGESYK